MTRKRIRIGTGPGEFIAICIMSDSSESCDGHTCPVFKKCYPDIDADENGYFWSDVVTMKAPVGK
jgi:hypothetical protein